MAQVQTNGAAATAVAEGRKQALSQLFTPEEARTIKAKIETDAGRAFAEMLQRDAFERPKIVIDDKGKLVPKDFDSLFRIARWIESLRLYGVKEKGGGFRPYTVEECAAIIAAGQRVGMDPFYAMETIALINNKTCIFGRGVRGVILASGLLEDWSEHREGFNADGIPGESARVTITLKRKGVPTPIVGTFSVAQAKAAGLWGGSEYSPWKKYPGDMLTWRAVGRASLGFSDVLGGMSVAEEVADIEEPPPKPSESINRRLDELAKQPQPADAPGREVSMPEAPAKSNPDPAPKRRGSQHAAADLLNGTAKSAGASDDIPLDEPKGGGK